MILRSHDQVAPQAKCQFLESVFIDFPLEIAFLAFKNLKNVACGAVKCLVVLNTFLQPAAGAKKKLTSICAVYLNSPFVSLLWKARGDLNKNRF